MRASPAGAGLLIAAGLVLSGSAVPACAQTSAAPAAAPAAATPTPHAIVKALTPPAGLSPTRRGIRVVHGASAPAPAPAPAPSVSLTVDFATGSAGLTAAARHTLDQLGAALKDPKLAHDRFRIEGHTDTVGTKAANLALSQRRAQRVAHYLEDRFAIAATRLQPVGMGEQGLLVATPPQTPEAKNRRVVVVNKGA